jgi:hypothetical protein
VTARKLPPEMKAALAALRSLRIGGWALSEAEIRDRILAHLVTAGIRCQREVVFAKGQRADIWIDGGVIIELKRKRPHLEDTLAQVTRYAATGAIKGIIVICGQLLPLPSRIKGIPCAMMSLSLQWGIAL